MAAKKTTYESEVWHLAPDTAMPDEVNYFLKGQVVVYKCLESDVPSDDDLIVMPMLEGENTSEEINEHWDNWRSHLEAGKYVKLVHGGKAGVAKHKAKKQRDRSGERLTLFFIEQQTKPEYWEWSEDELKTFDTEEEIEKTKAILKVIKNHFEKAGYKLSALYGKIHSLDTVEGWSDSTKKFENVPKEEHIHIIGELSGENPLKKTISISEISSIVGVPKNQVEPPKSGRYSKDNKLAYLIHAKDPDKYRYYEHIEEVQSVVTLIGRDYMQIYAQRKGAWERGAAKKTREAANLDIDWLLDKILFGEITMDNILLSDDLYKIYSTAQKKCDDALELYGVRHAFFEVQALEKGEFECSLLYLEGPSGSGKSTFLYGVVNALESMYGWSSVRLARDNSLDDYHGEEIVVLDDVRGQAMTIDEWLGLLDAHYATRAAKRYKNAKVPMKPRVIIISAKIPAVEYFYYARNHNANSRNESLDQIIRRIMWKINVLDYRDFGDYRWVVETPEICENHTEIIKGTDKNHQPVDITLTGLNHRLVPMMDIEDEVMFFSPWGVAYEFFQEIDKRNNRIISLQENPEGVFTSALDLVQEQFYLASREVPEMKFPDEFHSLPKYLPESKTIFAEKKREMEEQERQIELEREEERKQNEAKRIAETEAYLKKRKEEEKQKEIERKENEDRRLKQKKEDQIRSAKNHCLDVIVTNTEQWIKDYLEPLFDNEFLLAHAIRKHSNANDLDLISDSEWCEFLQQAYQLRFPKE